MRKILTAGLTAVIAAGAVMATAGPANADRYRRHYHRDNDDEVAAAILGGVAGLALGAALSNGSRSRYYDNGYYYDRGPRYRYSPRYDSYYSGGYGYRTCITRDRVYDPYIGRRVTIERRYA